MTARYWRITVVLALLVLPLAFPTESSANEGWASWYGPGFQGNHMANGQVFDMYDPTTTACNEFPLGTWLRVTNPANGRSVDVQVRDRGGFGSGLDMSYAAFLEIAEAGRSRVWVTYDVISGPGAEPAPSPEAKAVTSSTGEHVVQLGETLGGIAASYGMDVDALAAMNNIKDPALIVVGQRLKVSGTVDTIRTPSSRGGSLNQSEYVVQPGDTLIGIASRFGTDSATLAAANGIRDSAMIVAGQQLKVPGSGAAGDNPPSGSGPGMESEYVVQPGDALFNIAMSLGTSVEALAELNGITDPTMLSPGQILKLPGGQSQPKKSSSGNSYEVQIGDTLYDIAVRFGTTIEALTAINDIVDPALLKPGLIIRLH